MLTLASDSFLLGIGFVPAVIVAWAFELTPAGFIRDSEVDRGSDAVKASTRRLDRIVMVALALAVGYFAFDKFMLDPARDAAIAEAASTPMEISDSAAASAAGSTAAVAAGSPKYLCLIRHGQGEHNPRKNPLAVGFIPKMLMRDAKLTGKGRKQAGALQQPMQWMPFDLIVVSPLSRTIETATAAFEEHPTPKRLCHLMCERATMPADQGTPKAQLLKKHPQLADWQGWDELSEHFWPPRSLKTAEQEVAARVEEFKSWLLARPETCFALVGHSAFFMTMTQMERKLSNCEAFWCLLMPDASIVPAPELPPPPLADHDD